MRRRLIIYVALLLLPSCTMAQKTVDVEMESGTGHARIIAARKAASTVTAQQCIADLSSWEARDDADKKANEKAKIESPDSWYQKLSTEELVRLSSESLFCGSVLRHAHHGVDVPLLTDYGRAFDGELLGRAEAVLVEHHLMHEYLLKNLQ
jgi:hypothetical protein